jgi:hypothetical protein
MRSGCHNETNGTRANSPVSTAVVYEVPLLKDQTRLDKFNAAISRRYQNLKTLQISKYDDFGDNLQERQVLEISNTADLYNSGIFKVLKDKLDRRNNAAHPSNVVFVQSQADDMITDLVHNVVLALT